MPRRYLCSTFPGLTAAWHPRWRPHTTLAEQTALLSGMEAAVTACDLDAMYGPAFFVCHWRGNSGAVPRQVSASDRRSSGAKAMQVFSRSV